jgi:tripartite-type tricarboxylate transporter receptor subunit TctC
MNFTFVTLLAIVLASIAPPARAEFPDKPIRLVVPFAAGGGADATARAIAEALSKSLRQPVLVENKPGGDSTIGSLYVAKSPPDGYTLLFGTNTGMSGAPVLHRNIGYDPVKDLTPISMCGLFAFFLVVNPEVPAKTLKELIDLARANPGKLNYATGNAMGIVGTSQLMAAEKLEMIHVPYKGEAAAMPDLLGNRVQMLFATGFIVPHVREGRVRAITAILDNRSAALPDVPTIAEAGFPELAIRGWAGFFGPAGMPRDITARLSREINDALRSQAVQDQMALQGFVGKASTPAELAAFTKSQLDLWGTAVQAAGIKPD